MSTGTGRSRSTTLRWTGLGVRRCRDALHALDTQITPVRVPEWDGEHWVIRADLDRIIHGTAPEQTPVSLLAALDPYTMGFRRRARLLDPDRQDFVYDRGGNATSLALVLIPGGDVRFFPFKSLADPVTDRIKVELARIGSFIAGTTVEVSPGWSDDALDRTPCRLGPQATT